MLSSIGAYVLTGVLIGLALSMINHTIDTAPKEDIAILLGCVLFWPLVLVAVVLFIFLKLLVEL
jgi:hypothetical protein